MSLCKHPDVSPQPHLPNTRGRIQDMFQIPFQREVTASITCIFPIPNNVIGDQGRSCGIQDEVRRCFATQI